MNNQTPISNAPVFIHTHQPNGIAFSCSDIYLKNDVIISFDEDADISSESLLDSIQSFIVSHQLMYSDSPASNIDYNAVDYIFND